jgi:hypothetical protein
LDTENKPFSPWCCRHWLTMVRKQWVVAKLIIGF